MGAAFIKYISEMEFNDILKDNPEFLVFESKRWRKLKINNRYEVRSRKE